MCNFMHADAAGHSNRLSEHEFCCGWWYDLPVPIGYEASDGRDVSFVVSSTADMTISLHSWFIMTGNEVMLHSRVTLIHKWNLHNSGNISHFVWYERKLEITLCYVDLLWFPLWLPLLLLPPPPLLLLYCYTDFLSLYTLNEKPSFFSSRHNRTLPI